MGIVKIDGLNISFGKHEILKDINLEIEKGEFVTITRTKRFGEHSAQEHFEHDRNRQKHSMGGQSGRVSDEGKEERG